MRNSIFSIFIRSKHTRPAIKLHKDLPTSFSNEPPAVRFGSRYFGSPTCFGNIIVNIGEIDQLVRFFFYQRYFAIRIYLNKFFFNPETFETTSSHIVYVKNTWNISETSQCWASFSRDVSAHSVAAEWAQREAVCSEVLCSRRLKTLGPEDLWTRLLEVCSRWEAWNCWIVRCFLFIFNRTIWQRRGIHVEIFLYLYIYHLYISYLWVKQISGEFWIPWNL